MDLGSLNEKIRSIANEIVSKGDFELVRTEIGGTKRNPIVRVFIDKPDGLTVEHCAVVSREIESRLDEEDVIPLKYVLEVSSPGLERELTKPADFARFTGRLVKVQTMLGPEGSKTFVGKIVSADDENVVIEGRNSENNMIPLNSITKANLKLDLDAEFGRRS